MCAHLLMCLIVNVEEAYESWHIKCRSMSGEERCELHLDCASSLKVLSQAIKKEVDPDDTLNLVLLRPDGSLLSDIFQTSTIDAVFSVASHGDAEEERNQRHQMARRQKVTQRQRNQRLQMARRQKVTQR